MENTRSSGFEDERPGFQNSLVKDKLGLLGQETSMSLGFSTCKMEMRIVATPTGWFEGSFQTIHEKHEA